MRIIKDGEIVDGKEYEAYVVSFKEKGATHTAPFYAKNALEITQVILDYMPQIDGGETVTIWKEKFISV